MTTTFITTALLSQPCPLGGAETVRPAVGAVDGTRLPATQFPRQQYGPMPVAAFGFAADARVRIANLVGPPRGEHR